MDEGSLDMEFEHEQMTVFRDAETGVTGVIAVHSTVLGPAMGGLRLLRYAGLAEATLDALRLARAMTLKSAAAGLDLGGGKAVLLDDGSWAGTREERMRAVGTAIERLGGTYITAEDVGTTPGDMDAIAEVTRHVAGGTPARGGSGDPSPFTARTVFTSIEVAVRRRLCRDSLDGVRVGVQGVGSVGAALAEMLTGAGAEVLVTDIDPERGAAVAVATGATAVSLDGFLRGDFDVLAPCALGGAIGPDEARFLTAEVIAGAANNPLSDPGIASVLAARGVLYIPDFIANSGGIIHVGAEALGLSDDAAQDLIDAVEERVERILAESLASDRLPLEVAVAHAIERISGVGEPSS